MKKISSIFIRQRNKKYYVYLTYTDDSGKVKQKNMGVYENKRDAEKKKRELQYIKDQNKLILPSEQMLEIYLKEFLEKYKKNVSVTTYQSYSKILDKHIIPKLGKIKLCDLQPIDLQNYIDEKTEELTPQTVKVHLNVLNIALTNAYKLRMIDDKLVDRITIPKSTKFSSNVYTEDDLRILLEKIKDTNIELPVHIAVGFGLRISEILGLRWSDINFEECTIRVGQITARVNGKVILKEPKTESSIRELSGPQEIFELLKKERKKQLQHKLKGKRVHDELIFFDTKGIPMAEDCISQRFRRFLKKELLKEIRFHDLRHAHATLLIKQNVNPKIVSDRLGHSNINTTLNIYAHTLKEMDREAGEKIEDMLYDVKLGEKY